MTFHAMRHVARVNRELRALSSGAKGHRPGGPDELGNVTKWLQSSYLKDKEQG